MKTYRCLSLALACSLSAACDKSLEENRDASVRDASVRDATTLLDSGSRDAAVERDASLDAAIGLDATPGDADPMDIGSVDGGPPGRVIHEATLLNDGRVLITGGVAAATLNTAAIYDPALGSFSRTTGDMVSPRRFHASTLLADGRVLLTGGMADGNDVFNTAEVFDPATGLFTATSTFGVPRRQHNAVLLPSGEVLLAAGFNRTEGSLQSAEIYAADLRSSRRIASPQAEAGARALVELLDGRFLVAGGHRGAEVKEAEFFNPVDESFTRTGDMVVGVLRAAHARLADGRVFFAGGSTVNVVNALGQIFDPSTGLFTTTTGTMAVASQARTANLLPSGQVLVAGGYDAAGTALGAELFDPVTQTFRPAGPGFRARSNHSATTLADGRVLIVGGGIDGVVTDNAQIYDPGTNTFSDTGPLPRN